MKRLVALLLIALAACSPAERAQDRARIAVRQFSSLDPIALRDAGAVIAGRQIYGTLLDIDPGSQLLRPGLAGLPQSLDGGTRFIFTLRRDVVFHDGTPLRSAHVVAALERLAAKSSASDVAYLLGEVVGYDAFHVTGAAPRLEGVTALDDLRVEIRLSEPFYDFPYALTALATAPRSGEAGTGPYRVGSFEPLKDVRLTRFDRYFGERPPIGGIDLLAYESVSAAYPDLIDGVVDVAEVPPGRLNEARARFGDGGFGPLAGVVSLGFNLRSPALASPELRRAVSFALDRTVIAEEVFSGTAVPAEGFVPKGIPGSIAPACGEPCSFDLAAARELTSALTPESRRVVYDYPQGPPHDQLAHQIARALGQAGFEVELRPQGLTEFLERVSAGEQQMFPMMWVGEYPAADLFLTPLFRSGASDNQTGFSSPQVDELLTRARATSDRGARLSVYRAAESEVLRAVPATPLVQFHSHYAARPKLNGFYVDMTGAFEVSRMSFAP